MKNYKRRQSVANFPIGTSQQILSKKNLTLGLHTNRHNQNAFVFPIEILENKFSVNLKRKTPSINTNLIRSNLLNGVSEQVSRKASWDQSCAHKNEASPIFIQNQIQEIVKLPLSPDRASKFFSSKLTEYEKTEILQFKEIFYAGKEKRLKSLQVDDEKKNLVLCEGDHVAYRYEIMKLLGQGSFSQVYEAYDWKNKKPVALKVIRNKPKLQKQAKIEVNILKFLKDCPQLSSFLKSFPFRSHPCIALKIIGPALSTVSLAPSQILSYSRSILTNLIFLHKSNIIHCDLKPSNILIGPNDTATIIDFGTSCYKSEQTYSYIQSRSYRAPEVIFRLKYEEKIDMWSFGCILYEMCTGKILFNQESEKEVLRAIVQIIGKPPAICINNSEKAKMYQSDLNLRQTTSLDELMSEIDFNLVSVVKSCLKWDRAKRFSAQEALNALT